MESFSLVSTPRYDPGLTEAKERGLGFPSWHHDKASPLYMLDYHYERLLKGAKHFGWQPAIAALEKPSSLDSLVAQLQDLIGDSQGPLRLRILVDPDGQIRCEKYDAPPMALQNLLPKHLPPPPSEGTSRGNLSHMPEYVVVLDTVGTANSEHTYFKTTYRPMYDAARRRAGLTLTDLKEVLLLSENRDLVTEGSITTPYFWRDGRWVTPPVSREYAEQVAQGGQDGTSRRWALER
jgi:4-amino-4-deoxychorismate lyase